MLYLDAGVGYLALVDEKRLLHELVSDGVQAAVVRGLAE